MQNKRGFIDIPFAWLFAIIVGAVILFLAIYISIKIIGNEEETISAKTSKEIGIILNPLETGFETGKTSSISFPVETRIYNECDDTGTFGKQKIRVSQKSFRKWSETEISPSFENKYIFSEESVEGKKFNLFSKPFNFPYKVADLIYITELTKEYCFIDAPYEIEEELNSLNQKNIHAENCSSNNNMIRVCFSNSLNCDVNVDYPRNSVEKNRSVVYFESDALMYSAIFSDKEIYECQLKRLMKRTAQLSLLYKDKASIIQQKTGCSSNLELSILYNIAINLQNSNGISSVNSVAEDIKDKNEQAMCRLW